MEKFSKGSQIFSCGTWETFSFLALEARRKDHTAISLLLKIQHLLDIWCNFLPVAGMFWMWKKLIPEALPTVNGHMQSISEACYICVVLYFLDEDNMCNAEDGLWEETEPKEIWRYKAESFGGTEKQVSKQLASEQRVPCWTTLYLLDWRWGCNHAVVIPTLAVNRERFNIPFPLLGRDTIWKYGKKIRL